MYADTGLLHTDMLTVILALARSSGAALNGWIQASLKSNFHLFPTLLLTWNGSFFRSGMSIAINLTTREGGTALRYDACWPWNDQPRYHQMEVGSMPRSMTRQNTDEKRTLMIPMAIVVRLCCFVSEACACV